MKNFHRNLYDRKMESQHFEPLLAEIERIRSGLRGYPEKTNLDFIRNSAMKEWLKQDGRKKIVGTVVFEIFNRMQFIIYTNIYKTVNAIDALTLMYNEKNYLGWILIGRFIIEQCAVFNYYVTNILAMKPCRNEFLISELENLESLLTSYSHGSRCNWAALLSGDISNFNQNPHETIKGKSAINIMTAINHLSRRNSSLNDIEGVYAIFSDFAHPNMASNTTVMNLVQSSADIQHVEIALRVDKDRGECIIIATLQAICLCLQEIIELAASMSPTVMHWEDELMQGKIQVHFDSK